MAVMKRVRSDLAIHGGQPAFAQPLYVGRPNIGDRQRLLDRIEGMLDRRWLTNHGECEIEFEAKLEKMLGVRHCIAVCNATIGLEIAARAVGLKGEVIVPSFTFVATAHCLQWQGITPVFCDVDPHTHCLDPNKIEALITPRTTGILGVHVWGQPCAIEPLTEIAQRNNLQLIFDAAHAFGCTHRGTMIGNFGAAEVFSFHATKFINSFEGGAIATNDDRLAEKVRLMKNFGFVDYDEVVYLGTNGKMSEVAAAMGTTSLESMEEFIAANRLNYRRYREGLASVPGITVFEYEEGSQQNFQYLVVEVDAAAAGISRNRLVEILKAENVLARRYFYPGCHRMEPYRSLYPNSGELLPETERLAERVMILPTGTAVGGDEIATICELIRFACATRG